jgi:hypothetical protein
LSRSYFGDAAQIPKPTPTEQHAELESGHH